MAPLAHREGPPQGHLALFRREVADLRRFVLAQDLVYVGGGNTANLLAVWRTHGLDRIFREAWEAGVVLAGLSAGGLCWFEGGVTGSFCPHYDGEAERRPLYQRLVAEGGPDGETPVDARHLDP